MRAGNFSAFGTTIYDPATGNADGTGRTPFPGNIIPPDRISSIAPRVQARLPLPTGVALRQLTAARGRSIERNNFDVKVNFNVSSAAQIWAKYSQMNATVSRTCGWAIPRTVARAVTGSVTVRAWATPRSSWARSA